ncbi:MAG: UDP-N-acetylmuramoyl-tripeptide--D-alanyl-D-alanine ligase [Clostridia bacterium]|nr:UDP-N-acetylmuramoyl-tripeptide--D-alanyl-D-alanine ligase [Clostridia bacterium]
MIPISFKDAAKAVGSTTVLNGSFDNICTDSRKIIPGCLFIAIPGERFDGHDYARNAIEDGAAAVLVERDCGLGDKQITVGSTRKALLDLAGYYRSLFNIPVVGVTGSVGKTTTKEMIYSVLSSEYKTLKNEGNLNNEIGVPLTLFRLDSSYEAAVIEMGMSGFGEISRMTKAVKPCIGVISNIGVSHIEKLGSREGILKAKLEITDGMTPGTPLILNGDDDMLSGITAPDYEIITFGLNNSCAYKALDITSKDDTTVFTCSCVGGPVQGRLPFTGRHNVYNALSAIAVGEAVHIPASKAMKALENYKTTGLRQKIERIDGITLIEDCYNASPDSQKAAMTVLGNMAAQRRIAVVGDMLELGDYSEKAHSLVGRYAFENDVDILFTYGGQSEITARVAKECGVGDVRIFDDKSTLTADLAHTVREGDAVLFKASRGMKLEDVIDGLINSLHK